MVISTRVNSYNYCVQIHLHVLNRNRNRSRTIALWTKYMYYSIWVLVKNFAVSAALVFGSVISLPKVFQFCNLESA